MQKTLINIDYLIINLKGVFYNTRLKTIINHDSETENPFSFTQSEYGTKVFSYAQKIYYNNELFASCLSVPRSSILQPDLIQLQLENHIFYTYELDKIKRLIDLFCSLHNLEFTSINRLDIALDQQRDYNYLINAIINKNLLVSGRSKSVNLYYETHKGQNTLNGFTIGKRSSSRFLRVYNKTFNLKTTPKDYITDIHKKVFQNDIDVWRYEYQLNAKFFQDLFKQNTITNAKEKLTFGIFDLSSLLDLLKLADKNFFELKYNTGKTEINKEKSFLVHCFDTLKTYFKQLSSNIITKIKKTIQLTELINKRTAKSLYRNYINSNQSYLYLQTLFTHLLDYNIVDWFNSKLPFYKSELIFKQKIQTYSNDLFYEHKRLFHENYQKATTIYIKC